MNALPVKATNECIARQVAHVLHVAYSLQQIDPAAGHNLGCAAALTYAISGNSCTSSISTE